MSVIAGVDKPKTIQDLDLSGFYGTEQYHVQPLYRRMQYTDGIAFIAETCGAYWLLDILGTEIHPKLEKWGGFLVIKLHTTDDSKMSITVTDGDYKKLYQKNIDYTDFPKGELELFMENDVLLLPSER